MKLKFVLDMIKRKKIDYLPAAVEDQLKVKPIYKNFNGWKTSTSGIRNLLKIT